MKLMVLASVAAFAFSGCSLIKNMDEMHDDTHKLPAKMDEMATDTHALPDKMEAMLNVTSKMSNMTGNMDKNMMNMYLDAKQGASLSSRTDTLRYMEHDAQAPESKIGYAGIYFMCYEFQLFKGYGRDSGDQQRQLFLESMQEFFRKIRDYTPSGNAHQWEIDPKSTDPRDLDLAALAVTIHNLNPNQQMVANEMKFQPWTTLDIIENAMIRKHLNDKYLSGKITKDEMAKFPYTRYPETSYVYEVGKKENYEVATYLLKVRANFLLGMGLSKVTNLTSSGIEGSNEKFKLIVWDTIAKKNWEANFDKMDANTIAWYASWFEEIARVRDELASLDEKLELDPILARVLRKMIVPAKLFPDLTPAALANLSAGEVAARKDYHAALARYYNAVKELTNPGDKSVKIPVVATN